MKRLKKKTARRMAAAQITMDAHAAMQRACAKSGTKLWAWLSDLILREVGASNGQQRVNEPEHAEASAS